MKKGGFLRNVLDTIRSNQTGQAGRGGGGASGPNSERATEFGGQLKAQHFSLCQVARHGFPEQPTALAFDPVQKISAIGTRSGAMRIFGRPGVDVWVQHEPAFAVTHIRFIVNQGALITVTADDSIHLWSLRGPNLKLQLSSSGGGGVTSHSPAPPIGALGGSGSSAATSNLGQSTDSGNDATDYLANQLTAAPTSGLDPSKRQPEILHTLKFQREHITYLHQTVQSKWLYIGTERGNVHVANVETFELSGYQIAWNKAIELSRKNHPGSIIHISECPQDNNKLLIGYESGCIVLWDLKSRIAEGRYYQSENLLWLAWHYEGKQFVAAHGDGSLVTWQTRSNTKPAQILLPHAKTTSLPDGSATHQGLGGDSQHHLSLASSFTRSLNNELYRPINKVEWKTAKSSEQFLLFSGGLPYDGLDSAPDTALANRQQQSQYLKAASCSPNSLLAPNSATTSGPSPLSPSISPGSQSAYNSPLAISSAINNNQNAASTLRQSGQINSSPRERKSLRSTSLTVMFGKSITVLEMDETIIDFITICDNSPYENDASDPLAVIVLLSNELVLIDLTSSGYPTFDSPYPSASLNESPVTCIEYLADCSSDLIPYLYSTSQNVISRAPKKGFSDKEWPINGGEWGQSMQSYPELVITGHADGTIKFWDMSGANFDLISKIKTSKLFERPDKLANSVVVPSGSSLRSNKRSLRPNSPVKQPAGGGDYGSASCAADYSVSPAPNSSASLQQQQQLLQLGDLVDANEHKPFDDYFAIEKIEFNSNTKHLLVAGALAQVIQFRLSKKESTQTAAQAINEITTILVDPIAQQQTCASTTSASSENNQSNSMQQKQHQLLKVRSEKVSGSTSSANNSRARSGASSGFQAEIICLTPLLVTTDEHHLTSSSAVEGNNIAHYCLAPPKITALALQATHNM